MCLAQGFFFEFHNLEAKFAFLQLKEEEKLSLARLKCSLSLTFALNCVHKVINVVAKWILLSISLLFQLHFVILRLDSVWADLATA